MPGAFAWTVNGNVAVPPAPVQLNVYAVEVLMAPVDCEPLVASEPLHAPDAVQAVALVEDQVKVDEPPWAMLVGLAVSETVGGVAATVTVTDWAAVPPVPVQVRVNFVVAVRSGVVWEPFTASEPLQPPEAVQAVALVDVHCSWIIVGVLQAGTAGLTV